MLTFVLIQNHQLHQFHMFGPQLSFYVMLACVCLVVVKSDYDPLQIHGWQNFHSSIHRNHCFAIDSGFSSMISNKSISRVCLSWPFLARNKPTRWYITNFFILFHLTFSRVGNKSSWIELASGRLNLIRICSTRNSTRVWHDFC